MNYNNRKGRKALRGLMVRSAIHADTKKRKHLAEHRLTVLGMLFILTVIFCLGMMFQEKKLEWEVMAMEASQVRQVKIASSHLVKEVATKEAELKALREVAEATKSSKPNVIYIDKQTIKGQMMDAAKETFGTEHLKAFENLITRESGFNPLAKNGSSGACGLFQAHPCSKLLNVCQELANVECQIQWGLNYIKNRYGTPSDAWAFWQSRVKIAGKDVGNWY